jgi:hypothetical protein
LPRSSAAAIGHQERQPRETLALLQRADTALEKGDDNALRVEVPNEIADCQLNLQQAAPALKAAPRTAALARSSGGDTLERCRWLTGHKTRSVFDRCDIVNEADLREAVGRLAIATGTEKGQSARSGRVAQFTRARK